jgi:hypothetical protein
VINYTHFQDKRSSGQLSVTTILLPVPGDESILLFATHVATAKRMLGILLRVLHIGALGGSGKPLPSRPIARAGSQ